MIVLMTKMFRLKRQGWTEGKQVTEFICLILPTHI